MQAIVATTQQPSAGKELSPQSKKFVSGVAMTLLVAGVLLTLLAASVMVIRIQRRRRSQARVAAAAEREATKYRADAWTEAGRRIQVEPRREVGSDDDTVDMDPGDLGPEDIDLDDDEPPYNGRGPR